MTLAGYIFEKYSKSIYPRIKHLRGATRLLSVLRLFAAQGLDKIEQNEESIIKKGDWDSLIILDACRHDLYEEINGETDFRVTAASSSPQYIEETFSEGDYSDIVYITGNPFFNPKKFRDLTSRELDNVFHTVFPVYETNWAEKEKTVLPEDILEKAITAEKLFPEKRKIIHFMQPHHPFVPADLEIEVSGFHQYAKHEERTNLNVLKLGERGVLSRGRIWEEYRKNLEFVMEFVKELCHHLDGRVVVTADHGNLMGENNIYGHDIDVVTPPLRKVPWDVIKEE